MEKTTHKFYVKGMHCASCEILIGDVLKEQEFINFSKVNLNKETIDIETESEKTSEELVQILNSKLQSSGYTVSINKEVPESKKDDVTWKAILIGLVFITLFFLLQKSGILNLGISSGINPTTSLIIGLIASFSSCLVLVGGLILSLSAKAAQDDDGSVKKSLILFHTSRLISFAVLGGILGLIGRAVGINFTLSAILGLIASTVMIILGFNLLGVFKKTKITLPSNIFSFFRKIEHATITPILIGLGTFFLPCGFTQSMQVAALSSGAFFSGLSIMFFFAVGTLPVLLILSFGSVPFAQSKHASLFFKTAGVVIIGFGLISLLAGLTSLGIINPLFSL